MPLYICNAKKGSIDAAAKKHIADAITNIHCSVTGAPASFVHAVFFEESALFPLEEKQLFVRGTIRKGRSAEQKDEIAEQIQTSLAEYGKTSLQNTEAVIRETPASWVLEGGEIMPEPGEEAAWFAAQGARRQAQEK